MSHDREDVDSQDIMVPEISSSTSDVSESRASTDDVMVAIVDSSVASPISHELDDESDNSGVEARVSNDESSSTSQEVSDEGSNVNDLIVGTTDNKEATSSMSQEVDDESSNTGEFMIESIDSDDTSSISQELPEDYPSGEEVRVVTKDSNDTSIVQEFVDAYPNRDMRIDTKDNDEIRQEVSKYSSTHDFGSVEDHSIAGEFSELVLTASVAKSEDFSCSEDCNILSPVASPTKMDTSNLSVDQTNPTNDQKKNLSSPSKRRHLSSKEGPESKKPYTSKESDQESLVCNYGVNLEESVRQSPVDSPDFAAEFAPLNIIEGPALCDLEPKTDTAGCSTNDSNKTTICKVPPMSDQRKAAKEINEENPKVSAFFKNAKLTWETLMEESKDQAINLTSTAIPSGSKDNSQRSFQCKFEMDSEIVSVGPQPPQESTCSEVANKPKRSETMEQAHNSFPILLPVEIQPLTRENFIPELESIVSEYMKEVKTETSSDLSVEERLRTFRMQHIEAINGFQSAMEETLARIRNSEFSPDLDVSSLVIISSDLLIAAVCVEKVWREFKMLLEENPNSISVINMTQHRTRCLQYFGKFILAILRYIYTLPDDYLRQSES